MKLELCKNVLALHITYIYEIWTCIQEADYNVIINLYS